MSGFRKNRPVDISSARYRLRSLERVDASPRWLAWAADPEIMGPLNVAPVQMSRASLDQYITGHDNESEYLIGIFVRGGSHIGIYNVSCDLTHRVANFSLLIGDKAHWGQGVVNETRAVLLDHFFDYRKMEKATGTPNARNFSAIFNYKAQGWSHEGTLRQQVKSVADDQRLDQLQFGMLPADWRARKQRTGT